MKNSPSRDRALTMATLSQLTYVAHNQGTEVVRHILKSGCPPFVQQYQTIEFLHAPRLFSSVGELVCCGFVLSTPNEVAIAIRGTENLDDYFFNLLVQPNSEFIHSGFHNYVENFWEQLQDFLLREDNGRKDIFVTGHSLGGAAATLIAKRLQEPGFKPIDPHVLETYTFGAPPVSTVELILDTPLYRFRNAGDFIPHLPKIVSVLINKVPRLRGAITKWKPNLLQELSDYCHVGSEYLIDEDYQIRQVDQPDIGNVWQWVQFSKALLPQLRVGARNHALGAEEINNVKDRLRHLIQTLIQTSLQEHRATKYVERLNFGKHPPWSNLIK